MILSLMYYQLEKKAIDFIQRTLVYKKKNGKKFGIRTKTFLRKFRRPSTRKTSKTHHFCNFLKAKYFYEKVLPRPSTRKTSKTHHFCNFLKAKYFSEKVLPRPSTRKTSKTHHFCNFLKSKFLHMKLLLVVK